MELNEDEKVLMAMYTFDSGDDSEMSVMKGDVVVLVQEEGDWMKVRNKKQQGFVPASYMSFL